MRRYKILARVLLVFFVVDFALAAPAVIQKPKVRVSRVDAVKDEMATSLLRRDSSGKRSTGHWREKESRQHNQRPRDDSNGSPPPNPALLNEPPDLPVDQPPGPASAFASPSHSLTNEPDLLNPPWPHGDSHALNPASPSDDSDSGSFLSGLLQTPPYDTPPGSPQQIASSPVGSPQIASSPFESPQIASSPASGSGGSLQSSSLPKHHLPSDGYSLSSVSTTEGSYPSLPVQLPTGKSYPPTLGPIDDHPPPTSPSNPGSSTGPHPLPSAESPNEDYSMTDLEKLLKSPYFDENHPLSLGPDHPLTGNHPQDLGTLLKSPLLEEGHPLSLGPNHPLRPGSTDNPPPGPKRPRPEDHEFGSSLSKIFKGKFKRRFSGPGALNAAQGEFQGTINSRAY